MLRIVVLALVLANAAYLVWVQGLLAPYGFAPASQAEPERLGQQVRPETIKLLDAKSTPPPASAASNAAAPNAAASSPAPAASAPASGQLPTAAEMPTASAPAAQPASAPTVKTPAARPASAAVPAMTPVAALQAAEPDAQQCLQVGLFTEAQTNAMRPRLQAGLPAGSWSFVNGKPVRWIVYMGKYINKDAMNKKRALLEQAGVPFETPDSAQLNPGLSLGNFKTKAQAEAALDKLAERGFRSAKVVPEHPETPTQWLRLPAVNPATQSKAKAVVLQVSGKPLQACS